MDKVEGFHMNKVILGQSAPLRQLSKIRTFTS